MFTSLTPTTPRVFARAPWALLRRYSQALPEKCPEPTPTQTSHWAPSLERVIINVNKYLSTANKEQNPAIAQLRNNLHTITRGSKKFDESLEFLSEKLDNRHKNAKRLKTASITAMQYRLHHAKTAFLEHQTTMQKAGAQGATLSCPGILQLRLMVLEAEHALYLGTQRLRDCERKFRNARARIGGLPESEHLTEQETILIEQVTYRVEDYLIEAERQSTRITTLKKYLDAAKGGRFRDFGKRFNHTLKWLACHPGWNETPKKLAQANLAAVCYQEHTVSAEHQTAVQEAGAQGASGGAIAAAGTLQLRLTVLRAEKKLWVSALRIIYYEKDAVAAVRDIRNFRRGTQGRPKF